MGVDKLELRDIILDKSPTKKNYTRPIVATVFILALLAILISFQ